MSTENIPLNKLTAWEGNVRKTQNKGSIAELATNIKAIGLQHNLIVMHVFPDSVFRKAQFGEVRIVCRHLARDWVVRLDVACLGELLKRSETPGTGDDGVTLAVLRKKAPSSLSPNCVVPKVPLA